MSGDILGLTDDSRALSASQLHLLLHPTEEEEDAVLRKSDKVRDTTTMRIYELQSDKLSNQRGVVVFCFTSCCRVLSQVLLVEF